MAYAIALAGKGGTGKTTIAGLIVRLLGENKRGSVLAVDADPNSNLGEVLGVTPQETIGEILDFIGAHPDKIPAGMTKDRFIEYKVQTAVQEAKGFDLLTMGKPEGPGCYCYVNNVLRSVVERLMREYDYVVIDNEAGLEHLSRRTTRRADCLLVVAQPSAVSLKAAQRIKQLVGQLQIETRRSVLLINASRGSVDPEQVRETGLPLAGKLAFDQALARLSARGSPLTGLSRRSKMVAALEKILEKIIDL